MTETYHYYFGYGMNTDPSAMTLRTGTPVAHGKALLRDYHFRFAVHADVIPKEGSIVHGVLWTINDHQLKSLDGREGYPHYYDRKLMNIECNLIPEKKVKAWVYYMTPGYSDSPPNQGYWNTLIRGYTHFMVPKKQLFDAVNHSNKYNNLDLQDS